jgi:hypothetical protein
MSKIDSFNVVKSPPGKSTLPKLYLNKTSPLIIKLSASK